MTSLRTGLRLLLLLAALLNYAVAASTHDHDRAAPHGESLCAICVYVGGSFGGTPTASTTPLAPQRHALPDALRYRACIPPLVSSCSIRGPPSLA